MAETLDRIADTIADRYRVERELGAGGMAIVYLAQDRRHERPVALKVLRPEVAGAVGADRFLAEIRTTATLQHPHILPLFDSGRVPGATPNDVELLYYVMPYVEGESLRARLARERQLPVAEATRLAAEIADALDYAHRRGVLHRDIKPENVLLHDGHALVADFGIALALTRAGDDARLTRTGLSVGTPQYMSPEQAAGERHLDARTDVYALGATLYEMLTGEPPHTCATPQIVRTRAATEKPRPIREVRPSVAPELEAAVMTALAPVPADRHASAADLARALRAVPETPVTGSARVPRVSPWRSAVLGAGIAAVLTAAAAWAWIARRDAATPRVTARLTLPLPTEQVLQPSVPPFAISRDGSLIAYAASVGGRAQLYLRPLDASAARAIPATDEAEGPFFSPDGRWIGYFAVGKLWKVAVAGGAPIALADTRAFCGASWYVPDRIVFSRCDTALYRITSQGRDETATVVRLEALRADSTTGVDGRGPFDVRWPAMLPDGRHALVFVSGRQQVGIVDLGTGATRFLVQGQHATYLPTGHLLFDAGEGRMQLAPFDPSRGEITGEAVPAFETFRGADNGGAFYSVSRTGTLLHVPGGFARWLVLTDRSGNRTGLAPESRGYRFPRFSPDGRRLAVTVDPRPSSIWFVDLDDWRATLVAERGIVPIWSPDGRRIGFTWNNGTWTMTGAGDEGRPLHRVPAGAPVYINSWSRDGTLFGIRGAGRRQYDLVVLPPGDSAWRVVLATPANERDPVVSPDGRWLAYASDRTGSSEVYVRPREGSGVGMLVSAGGGREPRWVAGGREIVFRRGSSIMAVAVQTAPAFRVLGAPRELFVAEYDFSQDSNWDVTGDGQRFVFVRNDAAAPRGLVVVLNWFESIRAEESTVLAKDD